MGSACNNPVARHWGKTTVANSSLWKGVIAWEGSRAASAYGIIWGGGGGGAQVKTNIAKFSGDRKV